MQTIVFDRGGNDDADHIIRTRGVQPRAAELHAASGDSLADITTRAYGRNTQQLRDRILGANRTLDGTVRTPY